MFGAVAISASGLEAQNWEMSVYGDDAANVDTVGFRELLPAVSDLPPLAIYGTGANSFVAVGAGSVPGSVELNTTQGAPLASSQGLSLSIDGPGFFRIAAGGGSVEYTRAGDFSISADGTVVDGEGRALLDAQGNFVVVPAGTQAVTVTPGGAVEVSGKTIAQLDLALPTSEQGMQLANGSAYTAPAAAGSIALDVPGQGGTGVLAAGALEQSNVNLGNAMARIMGAEQAYQANAKAFSVGIDLWNRSNQL